MKTQTFRVVSLINGTVEEFDVTSHSLHNILDNFLNNNGEFITFANTSNSKSNELIKEDEFIEEKQKYHNSRYNYYYKLHRNKKITDDEFNNIKSVLRKLMTKSKNIAEYEKNFEEYKKTLNK